jgi:hypothetical protein
LAKEIKIRLANGESVKNIKNELEISESNIKHIKYLDSWRDLLPELNNQLRK